MSRQATYTPPVFASHVYLADESTAPTGDPGLIYVDHRLDGVFQEIDIDTPIVAAHPDQGVWWEDSLYDIFGEVVATCDPWDTIELELVTDGVIPEDAAIFCGVHSRALASGAQYGYGARMNGDAGGNNDGADLYTVAGWLDTAIAGSAVTRLAQPRLGVASGTQVRQHTTELREIDGTPVGAAGVTVLHGFTPFDRFFWGATWIAGTAGPAATVRLSPRLTLLTADKRRALGG